MTKLTDKQKLFAQEYLVDLNATQAAIRAGYSEKTARQIGQENLSKPYIQEAIQKAMDERSKRTEITADRVLQELAHIAFDDIKNYLDFYPDPDSKYGVSIDIKDSREIDTRNIAEISLGKDGFKFKNYCKDHALVNLGKHLKLFTDKQEIHHSGAVTFVDDIGEDNET
jgi:phage terminase small subunit